MQSILTRQKARNLAIAGVAAAFTAGSALLVVPAHAGSVPLNYTCTDPLGEPRAFVVTADTNAPATIVAGQTFTPALSATVTVPEELRELLYNVGARTVEGSTNAGSVSSSLNYAVGGAPSTAAASIAQTPVPASGVFTVLATSTGAALTPTAAGQLPITAGDFTAVLAGKNAEGAATLLSPYTIPCKLDAGQNAVIDTVTVTAAPPTTTPAPAPAKSDTTTKVKAKFAQATKKAKVKVVVKAASGEATGKVKVILKKGSKKVGKVTRNLKSGKAKVVFKKITAKGKYKAIAKYVGSDTANKSSGKATFKVA